jgi:hypothetical protein
MSTSRTGSWAAAYGVVIRPAAITLAAASSARISRNAHRLLTRLS